MRERGLADPGFAEYEDEAADAGGGTVEARLELGCLTRPPDEPRLRRPGHLAILTADVAARGRSVSAGALEGELGDGPAGRAEQVEAAVARRSQDVRLQTG